MLDRLRKGASGWLAQLLIALLVVSFAVWGVSDVFRGFGADTVARVGGTEIPVEDFTRQYELSVRQLGQQIGQNVTPQQAQLFGVPGQVLGRLVADATLTDQAGDLGLGISSATLARQVAADPAFRGPDGNFDRSRFGFALQAIGMTEDQYLVSLRENYVRQQIGDALIGGLTAPDAYLRALHEFRSEERDISYLVLSDAQIEPVGEPTETDLAAYFEANKADWRAPEFRGLRIVRMIPEDLADTGEITDEAAREVYDAQLTARFTTPEQRQVEQIVFPNQSEADAAAASLSSGTTFDELMTERGLQATDVDLGLVTREAILDPAVAETAFSLAEGGVSPVVAGRFGPVIVRVTSIQPQMVTPFAEASAEIKSELAEQQAAAEIGDLVDVIEDARAGGSTLEDVAASYDLKVYNITAIDRTGKDREGVVVADLPGGAGLVSDAFESDVGLENNPVALSPVGYAWFEVTSVEAERDRELAEVRDRVAAAWKTAETARRLEARAVQIRDRLAAGDDPAAVATELGIEVRTAENVTRQTTASGDLSAQAIQATFAGPEGHAATANGANTGTRIVLVVTDATVPAYVAGGPEGAQSEQQISSQLANDLMQQYLGQLQDRLGVEVNQAVLAQLLGLTGT